MAHIMTKAEHLAAHSQQAPSQLSSSQGDPDSLRRGWGVEGLWSGL